jgi:hypothetical protein
MSEDIYYCPTCGLTTFNDCEDDELVIRYKRRGKMLDYTQGWTACSRCLIGAIKCLDEYMDVQRINRGISLRANRELFEKMKNSGCGCGG